MYNDLFTMPFRETGGNRRESRSLMLGDPFRDGESSILDVSVT
jgi:hypothetical protein